MEEFNKKKFIIITMIISIITILITTSAIYIWQKSIAKKTQNSLQTKNFSLQQNIESLKNQNKELNEKYNSQISEYIEESDKEYIVNNIIVTNKNNDFVSYESKLGKFSFQIPSKYILNDLNNTTKYPEKTALSFLENKEVYDALKTSQEIYNIKSITLKVFDNKENLSSLDWAKKNEAHSYFSSAEKYDTLKIDGLDAIVYTWNQLGDVYTVLLNNPNNNLIYIFLVSNPDEKSTIQNDFNNILKTIKFLK